jgi:hypothetical protein
MKIKSIFGYFLWVCLLACSTACEDNNSLHQKYIDEGETIYPGTVDSVRVFTGNEKAKFMWEINSDPRVTKVVISWNEGENSVEIPVTQTNNKEMEAVIDVSEGIHNFILMTMDALGHSSMETAKTAQVYGTKYISSLANRGMKYFLDDGALEIDWQPIENPLIQYVTVVYSDYTDTSNPIQKTVRIENVDTQTKIPNVRIGDPFTITTAYLPANGFETLDALPASYIVPEEIYIWEEVLLDKTKFTAGNLPGDNMSGTSYSRFWDGNTGILWVTDYYTVPTTLWSYPMYVSIDFGVTAGLTRFRLWGQSPYYYENFCFRKFEVWGTDQLKPGMPDSYWKDGDWKNDWVKFNDYEVKRPSGSTSTAIPTGEDLAAAQAGWEFVIPVNTPKCRYIRFVINTIANPEYTGLCMAEVSFWGLQNDKGRF